MDTILVLYVHLNIQIVVISNNIEFKYLSCVLGILDKYLSHIKMIVLITFIIKIRHLTRCTCDA